MRVVFLTVWFSEKMGYIENCLPKAIAAHGHEVHVISSTAQVYFNDPLYKSVYEPYLGPSITEPGSRKLDGFILHRLDFGMLFGKMYMKGLIKKLTEIKPDIVQVFDPFSFPTLQAAWGKIKLNYKYCTANHTVLSVFPITEKSGMVKRIVFFLARTLPGKMINLFTDQCFPATVDAAYIAKNYYGVNEQKITVAPLGVETQFFQPATASQEITECHRLRQKLGFADTDIVCIYTGRFTEGKNPMCLADAVHRLNKKGESFKALFVGNGNQSEKIKMMSGCTVHEFVPYHELVHYYRTSDIGVWPRQESTSMLDAAACGIPIIISNKVLAVERVEGNGLTYIENDVADLMNVLLKLKDTELRNKLGKYGIEKIQSQFSWLKIANDRLQIYQNIVNKK